MPDLGGIMKKLLVILAMSGAPLWGAQVDSNNVKEVVEAVELHGNVNQWAEISLKLRIKSVTGKDNSGKLQYAEHVIPKQYSRVWSVLSAVGVARTLQATKLNYLWGSTDGIYDILTSIRELLIGESSFADTLKNVSGKESLELLTNTLNSLPLGRASSWFKSDQEQLEAHQTEILKLVKGDKKFNNEQVVKFLNIYTDAITAMGELIKTIAPCGLSTRMGYWGKRVAVPVVVGGTVYCLYKNREALGGAASSAEEAAGEKARALADTLGAAVPAATAAGAKAAEVFTSEMKK